MSERNALDAIVVLRPLGLGDFLTGVPAYRALARAFPQHRRILAAPAALHPLLQLLDGALTGALDVQPLASLPAALHAAAVAVDLHGRGPRSHRVLLAAAPRRLIAFACAEILESREGAEWREDEHEVERWCRLLRHAGIPADAAALDIAWPQETPPEALRGVTLLHPGAASASRRWPAERWSEVARACLRRGERVVLTGSERERTLASDIASRAGIAPADNLAGKTSLLQLAALVANAARVLCGDTGVAHLATAYRTPSLLLFGPVPPSHWGPPPRPEHRVLWAGRRGDPHGKTPDPGLLTIAPAQVIEELNALAAKCERAPAGPVAKTWRAQTT